LTVFVIIAIAFIAMIIFLVFFMQERGTEEKGPSYETNPASAIQTCAKNSANSGQEKIIPTGGFLNPQNYAVYNDTKVEWMCYVSGEDELCTNLHPLLIHEMEKELENIIKPEVEGCFSQMRTVYQKYDYKEEPLNLSVEIIDGKIRIKINKKISYTQAGITTTLDNFDTAVFSPLYDFAVLTQQIISEEVECDCGEETCNADPVRIARFNPDYTASKFVSGGNEEMYSITEEDTGKTFHIAIRNCVRLP
jgi:hypothetical protein